MVATDQVALRIENLHVHYGLSHVLQGVTLGVLAGSVTTIVGRNGVGKTTLINTIMGLLPATSGNVEVKGVKLLGRPAYQRRAFGLALIPQGRRLFQSLSVEEHLHLVNPIRLEPFTLETVLELFPPLQERLTARADTLSGGERSMLSIARALIMNPDIILMDEPTEGLAPILVDAIQNSILKLKEEGLTVLLVEQKLPLALAVADDVGVMDRGSVIGVYPRAEIQSVEDLSELILRGRQTDPE
ncbi:MAG: ABC transporter ATP-binding protein [Candidatus Bipolaricaulia bacterium]